MHSDCFTFWEKLQVIKKIGVIFFSILMLFGCAENSKQTGVSGIRYAGFESDNIKFSGFKAAMLLPLSGKNSKQGEGLQNAALLATEILKNQEFVLDFYDTKSTPEGALQAARSAISQDAQLLFGPLTAEEVMAIADFTKSEKIPVVSFSSSPKILEKGIYTIGLLGSEQISAITDFAISKGRKNFAMIVPDNAYGLSLAKATYENTLSNNASLIKIGFYPPESIDFTQLLEQMTDYNKRVQRLATLKNKIENLAHIDEEKANEQLKKLKTMDSLGGVDFDAIIIPESGSKLKTAASMLGYYDVFSPEVMILGISTWDNADLSKETTLYGAYYPALSKEHMKYFSKEYYDVYKQYPENLYTFAYDAVIMLADLAKNDIDYVNSEIIREQGFNGVNGIFKFYDSGQNKHNMKIFEVTEQGPKEIDNPETGWFHPSESYGFIEKIVPEIYGKDKDEVLRFLMADDF